MPYRSNGMRRVRRVERFRCVCSTYLYLCPAAMKRLRYTTVAPRQVVAPSLRTLEWSRKCVSR